MHRAKGFTVIEIVIVIVILSVISVVAMSRIIGAGSFNELIVRDQIISLARIGLQSSLGRADVEVTITPNGAGDEVTIEVVDGSGTIQESIVSIDGITLSGDINDTDSCDTTSGANSITNVAPMTIAFDELGDLDVSGVTGSTGAITSALRVCINDDPIYSVCVSPSGFAYAGDCDV